MLYCDTGGAGEDAALTKLERETFREAVLEGPLSRCSRGLEAIERVEGKVSRGARRERDRVLRRFPRLAVQLDFGSNPFDSGGDKWWTRSLIWSVLVLV